MRVLWLSPWLRPLARVHVEALQRRGHEVVLVTSDQHPESDAARAYELVLRPSPKRAATWPEFATAARKVARFDADVAVTELVRDPRWLALTRGVPRITAVHDDRPHDAGEQRPGWERALFDRHTRSAAATVAFSRYVQREIDASDVVGLPSDLAPELADEPVAAGERRDVVLAGRLNAYKNIPVVLDAWRRHVAGPGWRGDDLLLIGAGQVPAELPPHVRHVAGEFRYDAALPAMRRAKASVAHYRRASQSGVQVLAMQLGVVPVVSPVGALPEFQPAGETPIGVDDVAGLAARFDELADPEAAARRGRAAAEHYARTFAADVVAAQWDAILRRVVSGG